MGRRAPRPIGDAIGRIQGGLKPPSRLAAVQVAWPGLVGEAVAAVTRPVSERQGTLTINCADSVWAEELSLMGEQLLERLREGLGEKAPEQLKFRVGDLGPQVI